MIKCLAIDDDLDALENLSQYLSRLKGIQLLQRFTNPVDALEKILDEEDVDVIFMDIEMPNISGLELAELIRHKTKHLIFTTSHSRYAVDAFGLSADAYLLKPYTITKLEDTLNKIFYFNEGYTRPFSIDGEESFFIHQSEKNQRFTKLFITDVVAAKQDKDKFVVYTTSSYIKRPLSGAKDIINTLLKFPGIIQVDQFSLINERHILKISNNVVTFEGDLHIPVGKEFIVQFIDFTKNNLLRTKVNFAKRMIS